MAQTAIKLRPQLKYRLDIGFTKSPHPNRRSIEPWPPMLPKAWISSDFPIKGMDNHPYLLMDCSALIIRAAQCIKNEGKRPRVEHAKQSDENQAYVGEVRISWVGS